MKPKILIPFLIALLTLMHAGAYTTNSSGMVFDFNILDGKSTDSSSSNFKALSSTGALSSSSSSANFNTEVGSPRTMPYVNGEACQVKSECAGGYCCSNVCQSSACAVSGSSSSEGGGGSSGGSSGGGGSSLLENETQEQRIKDFSVIPSSLKEHISLGSEKTVPITIKNTGNTNLSFELSIYTINEFIELSEAKFMLKRNEEKSINIKITGKKLGSYIGEIRILANGIKKSLAIVIEVASEQVLLDAKIDIPSDYKEVAAGGNLKAQITLFNVGPEKRIDVKPRYIIKDKQGNIVYEVSESFTLEKQISYVKSLRVPENWQPGEYVLTVEIVYNDSLAISSDFFKVVPDKYRISKIAKANLILIAVLAIFIVLVFLSLFLPKLKGKAKKQRKNLHKKKPHAKRQKV